MHHSSISSRTGFTLAECLIAVTIFAAGLVGLCGTALWVQRSTIASAGRAGAALAGSARLEALRGASCAARTAGTASWNGIVERWSIAAAPDLTLVRDSLSLPPERGAAAPPLVLEAALPC